jgi:hypothetical protein
MKLNVCANCGGEEAIHQYETLRCPRNGSEFSASAGLWKSTFWDDGKTEDDIETLRAEVSLLNQAIKNLMQRVVDLERYHND